MATAKVPVTKECEVCANREVELWSWQKVGRIAMGKKPLKPSGPFPLFVLAFVRPNRQVGWCKQFMPV
jgi:hypothetical protein